jgi:hypothetical protein
MLKAIKHLSMNATLLEVLQNANAIEILTRILGEQSSGLHSAVRSSQKSPFFFPCPGCADSIRFVRKCPIIYSRRATTSVG